MVIFSGIFDCRFRFSDCFAVRLICHTICFWKRNKKLIFSSYYYKIHLFLMIFFKNKFLFLFQKYVVWHIKRTASHPLSPNLRSKILKKIITKSYDEKCTKFVLFLYIFQKAPQKWFNSFQICIIHTTRTQNLSEL